MYNGCSMADMAGISRCPLQFLFYSHFKATLKAILKAIFIGNVQWLYY